MGHHHHPREEETTNFKVLYDADLIVNLEEKKRNGVLGQEKLARLVDRSFLTQGGRKVAAQVLLEEAAT